MLMFHAHIDKFAVLYIVNLKIPHYALTHYFIVSSPGGFMPIPRSGIAEIPIFTPFRKHGVTVFAVNQLLYFIMM